MMLFSFMGGVSFGGRLRARGSGCGHPKATPPSLRLHTFRAYLPGANGEAEDHSNQRQRSSWRREQWVPYILALVLLSVFMVATGLVVFPLLIAGYVTLVFV